MITTEWLNNQEMRSELAESVEFPIDAWKTILQEVRRMKNLAEKMQSLFDCKEGTCRAEGKMNEIMSELIVDTAAVMHDLKYSNIQ